MTDQLQQKHVDKPHIMVVDDDVRISELVSRFLREQGFITLTANSAKEAIKALEFYDVDALVLDVMMPEMTGMEMTAKLREQGKDVPILLLTALGEIDDRITGFESGADDYLTKPFEPKELALRLHAILKRTRKPQNETNIYTIGKWHFDSRHDEISHDKDVIDLTSVEAGLLRALCESFGEVVSREELAKRCNLSAGERTIDVQVTRLRRKIEENTKFPRYLQTVRGKGYILRAKEA